MKKNAIILLVVGLRQRGDFSDPSKSDDAVPEQADALGAGLRVFGEDAKSGWRGSRETLGLGAGEAETLPWAGNKQGRVFGECALRLVRR